MAGDVPFSRIENGTTPTLAVDYDATSRNHSGPRRLQRFDQSLPKCQWKAFTLCSAIRSSGVLVLSTVWK